MDAPLEAFFYNALNLAAETNYQFLSKMKERFGSFQAAWSSATGGTLVGCARRETIDRFLKQKSELDLEKEWKRLGENDVALVLRDDEAYPDLLQEIPFPPHGLYMRGASTLNRPIAVVGTRKSSEYGNRACEHVVADLVRFNTTIVSGLALGIDETAHRVCVENKKPTIAVIGSGLDRIYPATNKKLAEKITACGGAIISEYPLTTPPLQRHFPARNRIVSGISLGVIVIEAPEKSGSLITAYLALDQNRDIFVIPGSIFSSHMKGSHRLLKLGAKIVISGEDIAEEYGWTEETRGRQLPTFENKEQEAIIHALQEAAGTLDVDAVRAASGLSITIVNQELSMLLLAGTIKEVHKKYYLA